MDEGTYKKMLAKNTEARRFLVEAKKERAKKPRKRRPMRRLTNREKWDVMEKGPKFHGTK